MILANYPHPHTLVELAAPQVDVKDKSRSQFAVLLRHKMLWHHSVHIPIYIFSAKYTQWRLSRLRRHFQWLKLLVKECPQV